MPDIQNKIRKLADGIVPILKRNGVIKASIFGSAAKEGLNAKSDLDLLVEYNDGMTLFDVAGLKIELEERVGRKVDLITPKYLHPRIKESVLKEQIRIL